MTQYELPDGFQGMETAPKNTWVNVIDAGGNYGRGIYLEGRDIYRFAPMWIGWAPIVPPKKKVAWGMEISDNGSWFEFRNNGSLAFGIATGRIERKTANQLLAILNEQAYEGGV